MHPFANLPSLARSLQCLQLICLPLPQYVHWDLPNGSTSDVNKLLKMQATPFLKRILMHLDVDVLGGWVKKRKTAKQKLLRERRAFNTVA